MVIGEDVTVVGDDKSGPPTCLVIFFGGLDLGKPMPEITPKHIVFKQFERIVVLKGACNGFNRLHYFDEDHTVGIVDLATRVNPWDAFWMADTSSAWVDAKAK